MVFDALGRNLISESLAHGSLMIAWPFSLGDKFSECCGVLDKG